MWINIRMGYAGPYSAGTIEPNTGVHTLSLNLLRSDLDPITAVLFRHVIELWCESHCMNGWLVEHSRAKLTVYFSSDRDMVLFKLSPEWDAFERERTNLH